MYGCPWTQYVIQYETQYETQYGNQRKKTKTKLVCGWASSHAIWVLVNWGEASLFFSGENSMQAFIPGMVLSQRGLLQKILAHDGTTKTEIN